MIDTKPPSPLDAIPSPEVIQARLGQIARERALLRELLRLSKRRQDWAPERAHAEVAHVS